MNTGQTVYKQLQEMLNKCIDLGWKPAGCAFYYKVGYNRDNVLCFVAKGPPLCNDIYNPISYHELFSKDSGIMEFVEWEDKNLPNWYYITMCGMTGEEKVKRFVNNAIIPTK